MGRHSVTDWKLQHGGNGTWVARHATGHALESAPMSVVIGSETRPVSAISIAARPQGAQAVGVVGPLRIAQSFAGLSPDWFALEIQITNTSQESVAVRSVQAVEVTNLSGGAAPLQRALRHGHSMLGYSALEMPSAVVHTNDAVVAFTDVEGRAALVMGSEDPTRIMTDLEFQLTEHGVEKLVATIHLDGMPIRPGVCMRLPRIIVGTGQSMSRLMDEYASQTGGLHGARVGRSVSGWCSWYDYYGTETEQDVLENTDALAGSEVGKSLQYIQIDDGWNLPTADHARVWGDWTAGAKFPDGMKAVADRIRDRGYLPGLWLAPFSVDPASRLFAEHPDWLIQSEEGGPKEFWGVYGLDLSQERVLQFVRETFQRVFDEWGFEYVKIDFLLHALIDGKRQDPAVTRAHSLRKGLEVIREVAGARFILACGCHMGSALGLADAMRLGADCSARWHLPINVPTWPAGNCCVRASAVYAIWRNWMHGHWWRNDPDCIKVGSDASSAEKAMFAKEFDREFATTPAFGLSDDEARFWANLIWITGGLQFLGEDIRNLTADRVEILSKALPENVRGAQWVDEYTNPELAIFQARGDGPVVLGAFNLSDQTADAILPLHRVRGLKPGMRFRERLTDARWTVAGGENASLPSLPPHAGCVWIEVAE